ncbi:VOC family protein [Pseudovibrio exalbescens]|uniref:Glyoxalase-like domain-containing protein n=1 Tax=Pseudovibrio exalbescens TaxID=197461 RepID=A0A1U7JFV1_9HYPH|nr:VOC family protein [Pseudovibrio exalbescens]OKL43521.1 hypothetical protein A3843_12840 [Pseudovibrio exalbescens]
MKRIDHVVLAGRSLERLASCWERLGFTLTPQAQHPWGTQNRLIQIGSSFLELLSVTPEASIPPAGEGEFSFGAFNAGFLKTREGASMLVLSSDSPDRDRTAFETAGLPTYKPFSFEREAVGPDGTVRPVGFDLTFTSSGLSPNTGFFTCYNRYPENFWQPEYAVHQNGAQQVLGVVFVADDPGDHHGFLKGFSGVGTANLSSLGITLELDQGYIKVLSPSAFESLYGFCVPVTGREMRLALVEVGVSSFDWIKANHPDGSHKQGQGVVVKPEGLYGVGCAFREVA